MAINFPNSPTNNQEYIDSTSGNKYVYNSTYGFWKFVAAGALDGVAQGQIVFDNNNVANGSNGLIFNSSANTLFANTINVSGNVAASYFTGNGIFLTGIVSDYSPAFLQANIAYSVANSAFVKANSANVLAFNTGVGANAFTSATIAGANAAVGAGANAYASVVGTSANAFTSATIAGANTAVGAGANSVGIAAFTRANSAQTVAVAAFDKANTAGGGGSYFQGNNGDVGTASGLGDIFRVHTNTMTANVTIYSGNNAICAGPIVIQSGKSLTIEANARVVIS
jgi:hypothetical protein